MSQFSIKTDGYCIDRFTDKIKEKIDEIAAEELKQTTCEIVQNCVDVYSNTFGLDDVGADGKGIVTNTYKGKIPDGTTGLIYGKVQSGKTNTNVARQSRNENESIADSPIFVKIGNIRREVANHVYLQITATPQSLLLQNLSHPCKPAFCAALPQPGDTYMGGDLFFGEDSQHCCLVKPEEMEELKNQNGNINPGDSWNIPDGLKLALSCFFLASIYKMQATKDDDTKYSFLAHICYKQDNHSNLEKIISDFIIQLDQSLRGKESAKKEIAVKLLEKAYQELSRTSSNLPPIEKLIEELKYKLRSAIPKVVNANNPEKELKYNSGMNILIGGNRLGRGVTIEGLMVTYYGRDARQKTMDTVHQHARMFGYRQGLKDVTRLFLTEDILEDFRAIHEADEGMRQAIGEDLSQIQVQPVWIGNNLQPTRSNVLNPAGIGVFVPGTAIFPRDPLWKASDIKQHTGDLDRLLSDYKGDEEYHEVDINFLIEIIQHTPSHYRAGYPWDDTRVEEVMKSMNDKRVNGILNVRRGRNGDGLDLKNQKVRPWKGSGFAFSRWISKPKELYPDRLTLILMYQKGERTGDWEHPIYLPTLILPKSKFVFMFNNMTESENSN